MGLGILIIRAYGLICMGSLLDEFEIMFDFYSSDLLDSSIYIDTEKSSKKYNKKI